MEHKNRPVFVCSGCGDDIHEGEKFLNLINEQFCMSCVEGNTETAVWVDDVERE